MEWVWVNNFQETNKSQFMNANMFQWIRLERTHALDSICWQNVLFHYETRSMNKTERGKHVWMNPVWDLTGGFGITKTDFFLPNVSQLSILASPAILTKAEQKCKHCQLLIWAIFFHTFPSPMIGKIRTSFQWKTWANVWKKNSVRNALDFSRRCQWAANYNWFKQLFAIIFHREKMWKIILKCIFQLNSYW